MIYRIVCPLCQNIQSVEVPNEAYTAWRNGMFIQDAMPMLTPGQRELFQTGICESCFESLWEEVDE